MIRRSYRRAGFTVIETVLVLAIAGLLLAGIIAGQAGVRRNNAFTAALDQVQTSMKTLQNDSRSTISTRVTTPGTSQFVIEGKVAEFNTTTPTTYTTYTLVGYDSGDLTHSWAKCDPVVTALPDGITYTGTVSGGSVGNAIVFRLDPHQIYSVNDYDDTQAGLGSDVTALTDATACAALPASGPATIPTGNPPLPDTTKPTVKITAPANGATVSGIVAIDATATDNVGVTSVQFKVDGVNVGSAETVGPYSYSWNTGGSSGIPPVSTGPHTLTAIASDAAGNTASDSIIVNVGLTCAAGQVLVGGRCVAQGPPTSPPNPSPLVYNNFCIEGFLLYITQGFPTCLPQDNYTGQVPPLFHALYNHACVTTSGTRYVYVLNKGGCPTGTSTVSLGGSRSSLFQHLADAVTRLKTGVIGVIRNPLGLLTPTALANPSPNTNILDPNNYSNANFNAAQSLQFKNPDNSSQIGSIYVDSPNNNITWTVN